MQPAGAITTAEPEPTICGAETRSADSAARCRRSVEPSVDDEDDERVATVADDDELAADGATVWQQTSAGVMPEAPAAEEDADTPPLGEARTRGVCVCIRTLRTSNGVTEEMACGESQLG